MEDFRPFREGEVRVYICGLTVYDFMHIGHARTYIAFDAILRYIKYRGYSVRYVQNVTDIDDKIIKRANERKVDPLELSRDYASKAVEDQEKLGLMKPDAYPKVSENIPEILSAVESLVDGGRAYVTDSGVYFDVSALPDYGRLSRQDTEQLSRHRIEPDQSKRNPLDFALWKRVPEGEVGFASPWGYGRPGWHIECSVMSRKYLGEQFDIHGGALDLVFPHHENEMAQSESLTGKPFVKYWMHTGFLYSSGEKMSKSLGNIIPVREFLKKHSREALRLFVLQTHYRSPVDYGEESIVNAEAAVGRLRNFRSEMENALSNAKEDGGRKVGEIAGELGADFAAFMDDDFNTPQALAAVFDAVRQINASLGGRESRQSIEAAIRIFDEIMGVFGLDIKSKALRIGAEEESLIEERNRYRREKNWYEADRIRDILLQKGIKLVDRSDGTTAAEAADV